MEMHDVIVIGAGPAGLAAALAAYRAGAWPVVLEREARAGGILKQCIHDGFGVIRFNERLTGPEYAERDISRVLEAGIPIRRGTFITNIERITNGCFRLETVNAEQGVNILEARAVVLANGCRERTARQAWIMGERPAGVLTAGTVQALVNLYGYLPGRRCVILGSGDIGLIMARRMTLEGARVLEVLEAKPEPSGLTRNIVQCLQDFNIPLTLCSTVTRIFGTDRVEAVEVMAVDRGMKPVAGTERLIECDCLILSVGLIPENETAEAIGVTLDPCTRGPAVDQYLMTEVDGAFSCGNALHISDLADYVSESGEIAGKSAAEFAAAAEASADFPQPAAVSSVPVECSEELSYMVPQRLRLPVTGDIICWFRSRRTLENASLRIIADGATVFEKRYRSLRPPEMQRIVLTGKSFPESFGKVTAVLKAEVKQEKEVGYEAEE